MKERSTQLSVRKNPDSPRVHGLRRAADPSIDLEDIREAVEQNNPLTKPRTLRLLRAVVPSLSKKEPGQAHLATGASVHGGRCKRIRARGKWSESPLWEAKILLGVLREQGLAGKGLLEAFEKWVLTVAGCPRSAIDRAYAEQTGHELSDYILIQQADKTFRYNQLPREAESVRTILMSPPAEEFRKVVETQELTSENESVQAVRQAVLDKYDPNILLSTVEVANLTGFRPKTIRRWVSRRLLNYIRVGNRLRFRLSAVQLFLAQREVRK